MFKTIYIIAINDPLVTRHRPQTATSNDIIFLFDKDKNNLVSGTKDQSARTIFCNHLADDSLFNECLKKIDEFDQNHICKKIYIFAYYEDCKKLRQRLDSLQDSFSFRFPAFVESSTNYGCFYAITHHLNKDGITSISVHLLGEEKQLSNLCLPVNANGKINFEILEMLIDPKFFILN